MKRFNKIEFERKRKEEYYKKFPSDFHLYVPIDDILNLYKIHSNTTLENNDLSIIKIKKKKTMK